MLRQQENQLLSELRRTFVSTVDSAATDIIANADNPNLVIERIDSFTKTMEGDLKELKKALNRSAASLILSKECGFAVLGAATACTHEPLLGSIATVGCLTKSLMDYQDRRRKILREHPSAWLFASGGPRMPVS